MLFRVAVALTEDKMYCLGVWLVVVMVDTLKTLASLLGEGILYLSAGQSKEAAMMVMGRLF